MRVTWRDAVTAVLVLFVGLVYVGHIASWAVPLVGEVRGATFVLGIAGFAMCILGGSSSTVARRDAFLVPASILGGGAALMIVAGLISGWEPIVPLLAANIVVLWAMSTSRHILSARTSLQQT
jgi:hypothetical protein